LLQLQQVFTYTSKVHRNLPTIKNRQLPRNSFCSLFTDRNCSLIWLGFSAVENDVVLELARIVKWPAVKGKPFPPAKDTVFVLIVRGWREFI